ncbi:hypothetical protein [Methylobacterium dankookense]|uniref:Uncharacterized protein n=1 Tax=Methylobacterium dankookense TaxID=560405 RepID=A0A564FQP7_9HYPH|nr:hypothetical protein [Methylobacterium dankookense]GJD58086.1 hypothetical protein IFDJLNFL_4001 [Methylobacterium dankookense]VUF10489.1 hypothetical protein MTDSW087_00156 [Methylobacterium dankookense]
MREDVDARVAEVIMGLVRLSRLLPPDDMDSLLGAVAVEVETGMELVEERRHTRRTDANVVSFPGPRSP